MKWVQSGTEIFCEGKDGYMICELSEPYFSKWVEHEKLSLGSSHWDEAMERARLIVSAPELLESCMEVLNSLCGCCRRLNPQHSECQFCEETRAIRAAIARATGEEQDE